MELDELDFNDDILAKMDDPNLFLARLNTIFKIMGKGKLDINLGKTLTPDKLIQDIEYALQPASEGMQINFSNTSNNFRYIFIETSSIEGYASYKLRILGGVINKSWTSKMADWIKKQCLKLLKH